MPTADPYLNAHTVFTLISVLAEETVVIEHALGQSEADYV